MDDEIEELMGLDIGDNRTLAVGDTTGCIYCSIIQVDFRKHQKCLNRRDTLATTPIGHIYEEIYESTRLRAKWRERAINCRKCKRVLTCILSTSNNRLNYRTNDRLNYRTNDRLNAARWRARNKPKHAYRTRKLILLLHTMEAKIAASKYRKRPSKGEFVM